MELRSPFSEFRRTRQPADGNHMGFSRDTVCARHFSDFCVRLRADARTGMENFERLCRGLYDCEFADERRGDLAMGSAKKRRSRIQLVRILFR